MLDLPAQSKRCLSTVLCTTFRTLIKVLTLKNVAECVSNKLKVHAAVVGKLPTVAKTIKRQIG